MLRVIKDERRIEPRPGRSWGERSMKKVKARDGAGNPEGGSTGSPPNNSLERVGDSAPDARSNPSSGSQKRLCASDPLPLSSKPLDCK